MASAAELRSKEKAKPSGSSLVSQPTPEEAYLATLSPVEALKFRQQLENRRVYSPAEAKANLKRTGADLLYASPLGNALSARDAMEGKWRAQDLERQGDTEGASRGYAEAAANALMAFLPGMGRIGLGRQANAVAKEGSSTLPAILAYHGSPHDFEKFDMRNIGKGEGAQAYGHGLYFAENRNVARGYEGALARNGNDPSVMAREALHEAGGDPQKALESLRKQQVGLDQVAQTMQHSGDPTFGWTADAGRQAIQFVEKHAMGEKLPLPASGRLYKTELDVDHHQLLDWDKPLSEQGEVGRKALAVFERMDIAQDGRFKPDTLAGIKDLATQKYGRDRFAASSRALREAGIPGIRYLDQGSRTDLVRYKGASIDHDNAPLAEAARLLEIFKTPEGAVKALKQNAKRNRFASENERTISDYLNSGDLSFNPGSHNIVMFDDNLVKILSKE